MWHEQVAHQISTVEGGSQTLAVVGYIPNKLIATVKDFSKDIAKKYLPKEYYQNLSEFYHGLPDNTKVTLNLFTDGLILQGAGSALKIGLTSPVPAAIQYIPHKPGSPNTPSAMLAFEEKMLAIEGGSSKPLLAIEGTTSGIGEISSVFKKTQEVGTPSSLLAIEGNTEIAIVPKGANVVDKAKIFLTEEVENLPKAFEVKPTTLVINKVDDFGLSESGIHGKIEAILGNQPIVTGSLRELTALEVKLACEELIASGGKGTPMAGAGHKTPIREINRLVEQYGGSSQDWAKMKSVNVKVREWLVLPPNTSLELHWYENIKNGQKVDIKPKIQSTK